MKLQRELEGRRVALLAHPASMTAEFEHSLDALRAIRGLDITAAFGPQHGLRGDKQDNMIESPDFRDPVHGIPVFSLYGEVRRPTEDMLDHFDVLLVDLQDVGCRIYTFITTLLYVLEAAAKHGKTVWVLDRPNPAGRPVEGLEPCAQGWESFVGAGPIPMRHGLTLGELGMWFVSHFQSRGGLPRHSDARLEARRGAGLRLAARRAQLGEPQSERGESFHGARLCGHGDARGNHAVGGPRHHAAAGVVRCARPRSALAADGDGSHHAGLDRAAAGCGPAGSSRRSRNTPASCARGSRSTSKTARMSTASSGPGA